MQILKKITLLAVFMLALGICASAQVTVTGSTGANNTYPTLKDAFDAINLGDQTGNNISVAITANTTEAASAVLNAGLWTSLTVRPTVAATVSGNIVGAIIKLNSADNVTIDGRIGGTGTGRSLTVANTSVSGSTAAIWLASGTAAGSGAINNVIRNLELAGGAAQDSLTVSTFGIIMSGATISTTSNGVDNNNNSFIANRIIRVRYGIVTRGTTTANSLNAVVTDNIIGPAAFGADQIGKTGILMQADTGANVSRNTVQFVGGCLLSLAQTCTTGADRVGIGIGSESWSSSAPGTITSGDYTVTRNIIHDVAEERTFSAAGILASTTRSGAATNNLIANNFIYNVRSNGTSGDQVVGLGIAGGFSDRIVFNSISITGDMDPGTVGATSNYGNAIRIANASGTTHANLTLMNNSIYMDVNSNTATLPYFDITINSATYSFGTGGLNYNNYYFPPANAQMNTGGISTSGTTPTAAQTFNTLAQWRTALTPAQDANSIQADPQYVSNTADLHIAMASPNVNAGTTIAGVTTDIDGQARVGIPDIGADEPAGVTAPANDISANSFVFPSNGSSVGTGTAFAPQASFTNTGTAAQTNVPVRYRITDSAMTVVCNVTATIPAIDPGATVTVTFPTCTLTTAGTYTIQAIAELVGDQTPGNNSISGTITAVNPVGGAINVGTGGAFTNLTNSDGIFAALNAAGASSNVTINITSDLTAESGTVALNQLAGGFTVTIKPSGAARTISGSSGTAIIRLNDADNVTIDGSLTGGTAGDVVGGDASLRNLTIQNNSTSTSSAVVVIGSNTNGAQNNTVKNTNIIGNDPLTTLIGISISSGTPGGVGVDNDGNRVENCSVQKSVLGIYDAGASTTNPNTTNIITKNDMSATTTNRVQRGAVLLFNQDAAQVTLNSIGGINGAVGIDHYGIAAGIQDVNTTAVTNGGITNTTISRNRINGVVSTSTVGFSAFGIGIAGGTTGANTIANNMISGVTSPATSPDIVAGIFVASVTGSNTKVYFNSVSMTGDRSATVTGETPSYAIAYTADVTLELRDNIFYTTQIASGGGVNAKSYAIGTAATTFANLSSNFNDFWSTGANDGGFRSGSLTTAAGTDYADLAGWQAATVQDANSKEVDPLYADPLTDLHLMTGSSVINMGTAVAGVTTDFDGQTRDAMPDIGADEIIAAVPGTLALSSATYTVAENVAGGTVTITVNRTGGTDGAVGATYALTNGTATGGATCAAGIDYINTGGTVSFANGEASKTFTVAICNDTVFEGNETFNVTLSAPTGGATLGTPSTAVVTITDDEVAQPGTLALSSSTYTVGEAAGTVTVTVNRTGGTDGAVAVNYALTNGTATGGATCAAGVDYVNTGGTVNFANGQAGSTFNVTICNDTVLEGNETFNVTLSGVTGGATIGSPSSAVVTIVDDEVAQPGTLQLSSATYSVGEAAGTVIVTVTRTGGTDGAVGVNYSLADGTATGGATCAAGVDFINTGGTVSFANGETSKTFTVTICNDTVLEGNEAFTVTLSGATGGATIGTPSTATITIIDDEVAQPGTLQLSASTYTVGEAAGTVTVTVTRTGGTDGAVGATYALTDGTATGGATCAAGVDYVNTGGTVSFANGEASKTFTVAICNDTVVESNETFNVTLSGATGGATIGSPSAAVVTITDDDMVTGPVTVTATVGTASAAYANLTEAAAAINAGTHQGVIVVSINQTITEPDTVVINSSGAGTASYTSILIRPTADNISDSGASAQGRGLIELNGADNVTIDGDNPNSAGTNRNLTLQNTAANTVTFTSVIRVAVAATIVTSADNNAFRNLNILGSATGRNVSTATSTTGTENTTFGIFAGPGASTVSETTAPSAVASVSTSVGAGATAINLMVSNNSIGTAARGVSVNGSATTVFPGLQISGNRIGNQTAGGADQVYSIGITAQGSSDGVIAGNIVWVESFLGTQIQGINVGVNSATGTYTIERNMVNRVRNSNGATFGAYGINLGGGSNHVVQNNFASGVINDQTAGTGGFGTTFGAYGIRVASGTGHRIYHNSVHLYGAMGGVISTNLTAAFLVSSNTLTGMDVRNNIFSNQITGGNPAGSRNVAVYLPTATVAMNLTLNNNAYFVGTDALSRLAQVGTTFSTGDYTVANFDPTTTTPATNFRAYSSTLSAAGTNDNASFASTSPPPFTSNVNLHIPAGTRTRLESGGAAVGVTTDIDLETRNATTPDIGADEFAGQPPFANDIAAVAFVTPTNGATLPVGQAFTPQALFTNNGTATQTNVTVRYRITNASSTVIYNQTATIASIAPLQNVVVTFPSTSLPAAGTYTIQASAELAGDQDTSNDSISGTVNAVPPIGGTVTVGTGGTYPSLTNPGGIFEALNTGGISSSTVINIVSDLTAETGAVALNQLAEVGAGGYTVTIKPSGAARTISGTSAASSGLIILNGADRVIFDGSLSGGTDRSLTITNNQATTGIVIWMRSPNTTNGATNNTVKNCIINGAPGPNSTTVAGILTGSGTTLGGAAESPNSNNTIQNNFIYRVQNSLFIFGGAAAATLDQNWVITSNELGSSVANDKNIFRGMLMGNSQNFMIAGNFVHGIQSTATTGAAMTGIQLAGLMNGGTVANNMVTDIKNVSTTGTGAFGMQISATSTASNVTIANNFITDVAGTGSATANSNGFGMTFNGSGSGYNVYFNSVNMNTNQTTGTLSAAVNVNTTFATAGALNFRDNIFANTQTTGTRYAVYSTAAATVFAAIDYNDYFAQNVGFIGGAARVTLADWQTATGQDANSKAVDPLFVSATNLHLQAGSPVLDMGTPIAGITSDIDGDPRSATTPDIGADEIVAAPQNGTLALSAATYTVGEAAGTVTVTVNRINGTDGAVSASYSLANGTATGGATCGAGIDFVNTGGTVNFAAGEAAKTFTVTICNDTVVEPSETFTVTLSGATGGATIGTPATATVTITDDDVVVPSLTINDVRVFEGDTGTVNAVFTVTASMTSTTAFTVNYATANNTAMAGVDYVAASGTLTFAPGQTTQTITVQVIGDLLKEANETFFVNLSAPTGAMIADPQGLGVIVDDDRAIVADFDNDGRTDFSVFRPSTGYWYSMASSTGVLNFTLIGVNGDLPVPGDYDGDAKTDVAVFRPSNGTWYIQRSSDNALVQQQWGFGTDKPVQGDFDGDGRTDIAVFRPSNGVWYVLRSSGGTFIVPFGTNGDVPVQGDYDGDAKTDYAVYRGGIWYVLNSSNNAVTAINFGAATDKPLVGDFDGDGKADFTVYRSGIWYIFQTQTGTSRAVAFGAATDIPIVGDYDGDGTSDIAVFRPSNGVWYVLRSSDNVFSGTLFGQNGDIPIPAGYQSLQ